uniref:Pollen-specific protein SF3 n=2 Tax=Rhizophora mucronata TaxID=61149 RepID=A0A2P2LQ46_RHIMU
MAAPETSLMIRCAIDCHLTGSESLVEKAITAHIFIWRTQEMGTQPSHTIKKEKGNVYDDLNVKRKNKERN